ncbi:hypothetical protein ACFWIJ_24710 [Streptomyces sp. NPDC127079]|uniref:hypothetical protein n=1 Tax=Streptomyces sp. NPDC127079 TaxID=3347132 RepID=UPI003658BE60
MFRSAQRPQRLRRSLARVIGVAVACAALSTGYAVSATGAVAAAVTPKSNIQWIQWGLYETSAECNSVGKSLVHSGQGYIAYKCGYDKENELYILNVEERNG